MFVDSDDVLLPNAIECLLSKAYLEDADIVEEVVYSVPVRLKTIYESI